MDRIIELSDENLKKQYQLALMAKLVIDNETAYSRRIALVNELKKRGLYDTTTRILKYSY